MRTLGLADPALVGGMGGPAALWTPARIDTSLWLDAADASTITLNGSTVSQWNDKSGNGRHASQPTTESQPIYSATAFNNRPTLVFDGSNDFLQTTTFTASSTITIAAVMTLLANGSYPMIVSMGNVTTTIDLRGVGTSGKPAIVLYSTNDGAGVLSPPATPVFETSTMLNTANILVASVKANVSTIRQNGSLRATKNLIFNGESRPRIIGARQSGSFHANARISEIIELSNTVTANEQLIEGYFAHKWGLAASLPSDHPFKTAAPTV